MKKTGGTEGDLTPEWKANIMADKLADEYNSDEQGIINNGCLAKHFPGFLDQSKALADAGLLPGIGGVGKMTYTEFEVLLKKQRSNKMQKVPRETWTILKISL
jgi:hypothetical protein